MKHKIEYKSRWIWYYFWSWFPLGIFLVYLLIIERDEILIAFNEIDLPQILKYFIIAYFLLLIIHSLIWLLFGKYLIQVDRKTITTIKRYGLYSLKTKFEIEHMKNIKTVRNVKNNTLVTISAFWNWRLYAKQKEALAFEYDGKEKMIGMGARNFDADEIKQKIKHAQQNTKLS